MVSRPDTEAMLMGHWGEEIGRGELEGLRAPRSKRHSPDHPLDSAKGVQMVAEANGIALSEPVHIANAAKNRFLTCWHAESDKWGSKLGQFDCTYRVISLDDWGKGISKRLLGGVGLSICTNHQTFGGEAMERTKQTSGLQDREWGMYFRFFNALDGLIRANKQRHMMLDNLDISDGQAHDIFCRMLLDHLVNPAGMAELLGHWYEPEHDEFKARNGQSVFQAFTSRNRGRTLWKSGERDNRALEIIDTVSGVSEPVVEVTDKTALQADRIRPMVG